MVTSGAGARRHGVQLQPGRPLQESYGVLEISRALPTCVQTSRSRRLKGPDCLLGFLSHRASLVPLRQWPCCSWTVLFPLPGPPLCPVDASHLSAIGMPLAAKIEVRTSFFLRPPHSVFSSRITLVMVWGRALFMCDSPPGCRFLKGNALITAVAQVHG